MGRFDLFVSQLVVRECSDGDLEAVKHRLVSIDGLSVLPITPNAESLANVLIQGHAVPESQPNDALHIALAATHGVQYLVSWNFRHIPTHRFAPRLSVSVAMRNMIPPSSAPQKNCWRPAMIDDPIVNEIRQIRRAYAERFNNDLHAICEDLRRQERESDRAFRTPLQRNVHQTGVQSTHENPAE